MMEKNSDEKNQNEIEMKWITICNVSCWLHNEHWVSNSKFNCIIMFISCEPC
jgi:hypothetical protein